MAGQPQEEEIRKWHGWFARETNNRAWNLTEIADPTDEERKEALAVAFASAYHWSKIGTEHNRALAELLLARAHCVARAAGQAMWYAESAFGYFESHKSELSEMAFAHAILADAAALGGDAERHRLHYERAQEIGDTLEEEDRSIFRATFDRIPAPE